MTTSKSNSAAGTTYRIRVSGILGEEWSERSQGMSVVTHRSETEKSYTELIGVLRDEAALMGVLEYLYSHGAKLQSVEQVKEAGSGSENEGKQQR